MGQTRDGFHTHITVGVALGDFDQFNAVTRKGGQGFEADVGIITLPFWFEKFP